MKNAIVEITNDELDYISGGWDQETFLEGLGYAALGAVAIATAPFVAPAFGIGLAVSGGIVGLGGGAMMTLSTASENTKTTTVTTTDE
jgi:hypothetical protein